MALTLSLTQYQTHPLTKNDESGEAKITVAQATQGAVERIGALMSEAVRYREDDAVSVKFNSAEVAALQVYHTLVGTEGIFAEDGATLIFPCKETNGVKKLAMTEAQFRAAWQSIPPNWADEIYEIVLKVNPFWDSSNPTQRQK
jgi:hypothetical protein